MMNKKILISLPDSLLEDIDNARDGLSRSEFVRKAVNKEIKALLRLKKEKELEQGYIAMGDINLSLAEDGILADNEQFLTYEQKLSESE